MNDKRVVAHLGVIRQSMRWVLRKEVESRVLIHTPTALREYLRLSHGSDRYEIVRAFYLDGGGRLLREEHFERGTPSEAFVCLSHLIMRGMELGSRIFMIVHNHPSGDPTPSDADKAFTRHIANVARELGMTLQDHLIVAEGSDFSFRQNGLL